SVEKPGGRVMDGRCWNVRDGFVAETVVIYLSVAPVSKVAGIMRMITESEGWATVIFITETMNVVVTAVDIVTSALTQLSLF
nr:hypothetical protein [Tanacetum cinerariifolium]